MKPRTLHTVLFAALIPLAACQSATQQAQSATQPAQPAVPASPQPGPAIDPQPAAPVVADATAEPGTQPSSDTAASATLADAGAAPPASTPVPRAARGALPLVVVHKSPTCGCCHLWVEHMRQAGFTVEVRDTDDLNVVKERVGIPLGKGSCHTAEVGGYFVEGHVPAGDVKRLLAARPDAKGLVLPGMPAGSPGMELPDGRVDPYTVELVGRDGATTPYASHPE